MKRIMASQFTRYEIVFFLREIVHGNYTFFGANFGKKELFQSKLSFKRPTLEFKVTYSGAFSGLFIVFLAPKKS